MEDPLLATTFIVDTVFRRQVEIDRMKSLKNSLANLAAEPFHVPRPSLHITRRSTGDWN
jgi:hypothetical protein